MIILASKSPIRSTLLKNAGVDHHVAAAKIDEVELQAKFQHLAPKQLAQSLATEKALSVSKFEKQALVVGADQTLEYDGAVLHKCADQSAARQTLRKLSGQTHYLHSAISVTRCEVEIFRTVETASLTMREVSPAFLDAYLIEQSQKVLSSVGCYQLENAGINLFDKIEGDYFTILGLPLLPLLAFLRKIGELPS